MLCPSCYEDVPLIVRGVRAYCPVCGAPQPLTAVPGAVEATGGAERVGAGVATVFAWLVLLGGLTVAMVLGALVGLFSASGGVLVGGLVGGMSLLVGLPLMLGGKRLRRAGDDRALATQEQVLRALAVRRGGSLTAREAARALAVGEEQADALLTAMAKRHDGRVTVEIDDAGGIAYVFREALISQGAPRARVAAPRPVRVIDAELLDDEPAAAPRRAVR